MTTKNVLAGWVHAMRDGVLESHAPGSPVPDWVTNPALIIKGRDVSDSDAAVVETAASDPVIPAVGAAAAETVTVPDFTSMKLDALRAAAAAAGIATSGNKADLAARLTAFREAKADEEAESTEASRQELEARADELGIDYDEDTTDVELAALLEGE